MQLREYQQEMVQDVIGHLNKGIDNIAIIAGTGAGKAQPLDAKIMTPSGYKTMGELEIGDLVTGRDGKACRVTGVFPQGVKPIYKVTMSDGSSTECCDDHLWNVQNSKDKNRKGKDFWRTLSLKELKETYKMDVKKSNKSDTTRYQWFIPTVDPVDFFPISDRLPLDSYCLGLLLGDGCFRNGRVMISCPDIECISELRSQLSGICTLSIAKNSTNDFDYSIVGQSKDNHVLNTLRSLGLMECLSNSKFIPDLYIYSSINDRIAILQGLFDTDGYACGSGNVEYTTTSSKMADQVEFLVNSLGGTVSKNIKTPTFRYKGELKEGQLSYRLYVKLPASIQPFRLARKLEQFEKTNQSKFIVRRSIVNIELIGQKECQCISVSAPDQLYVTDNFIVTHNTVIAAKLMQIMVKNGLKILFLVHRDILVSQTADKLAEFGLNCGYIKAGYLEDPNNQIQIASVQTAPRRDWWRSIAFDVVIADEAHITCYSEIFQEIKYQIYPNATYLGLTATPYRLSSKEKLGDILPKMVCSPVPKELMDMGYLTRLRYFSIGKADLSKVKNQMGDYKLSDLSIACDTPELIKKAVKEYLDRTPGKRAVGFTVDVKHAENLCQEFRRNGVPAVVVSGKTPYEVRRDYYKYLREGKILAICSCNAISEGFDEPSVEVGLLLRPTQSRALYEQQIGRVMRLSPKTGKTEGIILDQAGNVIRHGFIEDREKYHLPKTTDSPDSEPNPAPLKECPNCGTFLYGFQMECVCGHIFPPPKKVEISGELEEIHVDKKAHRQKVSFQKKRRQAFEKGFDPAWANFKFREQYDYDPKKEWYRDSVFGDMSDLSRKDKALKMREYFSYLNNLCQKKNKNLKWVNREMSLEFGENWRFECLNKQDISRWEDVLWQIENGAAI